MPDPMAPPINPRIAASAEHVANDCHAPAADRAQHRDDRTALGDRHGHRGVDQERADHQRNHRAHQGHVVHHLDPVTGPRRPHTRVRDDGPAVHRGGNRGANLGEVSARFDGDQNRVELALAPGNVLRQRKWGKDVVSAIEIGQPLAREYLGYRDRLRAKLERLAFRVADPRADADTVRRSRWILGFGCPAGGCPGALSFKASLRAPPNAAMFASAPNSRTGPDAVDADVRIIGTAVATPGTAATSAVIVSGNPASVIPDTSSAATPAIPSANRLTDPVIDPKMPNIATRYIAETAITAIDANVRRRCTASSRRLNTRSRLAAAVIAEPGVIARPPTARRNRPDRPAG